MLLLTAWVFLGSVVVEAFVVVVVVSPAAISFLLLIGNFRAGLVSLISILAVSGC